MKDCDPMECIKCSPGKVKFNIAKDILTDYFLLQELITPTSTGGTIFKFQEMQMSLTSYFEAFFVLNQVLTNLIIVVLDISE